MKKSSILLILAATLITTTAGAAGYTDLEIARTTGNVAALQDYHGTLAQTGLYGNATIVSELAFRRPHEIRARVTAPAELAGAVTSYHDDELLTWWPKQDLALRIRHFVPPDAATEAARIADAYRNNLAEYFYGLGPVRDVAGKPTVQLDQRARGAGQLVQASLTRVFDEFSFPLAGQVTFRGGAKLDYAWQQIAFNDAAYALPAPPSLPASTMVIDWDLAWPARTPAEVAARLPAAVPFPERVGGLAREKLLVHPESLPAAGALYRDGNYYFLVTASRDTGWNPFSAEYGVAVPLGDGKARVVLSPLNSGWTFRRNGVLYEVLTNLHPEVAYRELVAQFATTASKPGSTP